MARTTTMRQSAQKAKSLSEKKVSNAQTKGASNRATTKMQSTSSKKPAATKPSPTLAKNQPNIGRPRKRKSDESDTNVRTKARKTERPPKAGRKPAHGAQRPTTAAATKKDPSIINEPPARRLRIYVFGSNQQAELGLGGGASVDDVRRPRLNPHLDPTTVGVVQVSAGGMHTAALTSDNRILTWGVNDLGALGRNTDWEGDLRDIDTEDSDSDEGALNPKEATPTPIDLGAELLIEARRFVQVAAGDNFTLALTANGTVYGWGTFKAADGATGFAPGVDIARKPILINTPHLISKIVAGSNHALALTTEGTVLAWGNGENYELGRHVNDRTRLSPLEPHPFGLKDNFVDIGTGSNHSFAIHKNGSVYAWGRNNFCQTGIDKSKDQIFENIVRPTVIKGLKGKGRITSITGGKEHSIAATDQSTCLSWGRLDTYALGLDMAKLPTDGVLKNQRDQPVILKQPVQVAGLDVGSVAASSDHTIVISKNGKAYSSGFSGNHQTGQGTDDDVEQFTLIDNTAVREQTLLWAGCGAQFSILAAAVEDG